METLKANLDDPQVDAASVPGGSLLVLAGPGSGKTRLLVHRVAYLLRNSPDSTFRILCLTFTVEAAKEMRKRITELVPRRQLGRVCVMNFHQFALDLLRNYGYRVGLQRDFGVLGEVDRAELVEEVLSTLTLGHVHVASVVEFISRRKGRREYRGDLLRDVGAMSLQQIWTRYEDQKRARNELDFDDLILHAVELLENDEPVRKIVQTTFRYIHVDELQDTSLLQLALVQLIYQSNATQMFARNLSIGMRHLTGEITEPPPLSQPQPAAAG